MRTGFFGKLPTAGDFVARDLPAGLRGALDKWLTEKIVPVTNAANGWPHGGLRGVILLNDLSCLILIEPSADGVGRPFPLVACTSLNTSDLAGADRWAEAVWPVLLRGSEGEVSPETLAQDLASIKPPAKTSAPLIAPLIWWDGTPPAPPEQHLPRLGSLSSG